MCGGERAASVGLAVGMMTGEQRQGSHALPAPSPRLHQASRDLWGNSLIQSSASDTAYELLAEAWAPPGVQPSAPAPCGDS